jgi:hypothetical protein
MQRDPIMKRLLVSLLGSAFVLAIAVVPAAPANASIHEIVAQWCAGHGELIPPGIQDGSNAFRPVIANGFIGPTIAFDPAGPQPAGNLITFNYGVPSSKVVGTGIYFNIASSGTPLYVEAIQLDASFPAFQHCPRLVGV